MKARIIPCLNVREGRVVKGVNFVDLTDSGDMVEAVRAYDAAGADELCFLDITASSENRDTIFDLLTRMAECCFMPLTVGGGAEYNIELTRTLTDAVHVPVIAFGGVGMLDHLLEGIHDGHAAAVLAAPIFHFSSYSIGEAKQYMARAGILVLCLDGYKMDIRKTNMEKTDERTHP